MKRQNEADIVQSNEKRARIDDKSNRTNLLESEAVVNVNECLQLFLDNKVNKHNAWTVSIIDSFSYLIRNNHNTMETFSVVGSILEASTKIYGIRVDCLYNDTIRMQSELSRQSSKSFNKKLTESRGEYEDRSAVLTNEGNNSKIATKKKQKKRRNLCIVSKNKESINAKLDTLPLADPFFAKLNSVVSDISSSKKLLLNILQSQSSVVKLRQNFKFWDETPVNPIDIEYGLNVAAMSDNFPISSLKSIRDPLSNSLYLRKKLFGYVISDLPMDDENEEDSESDSEFNTTQLNRMQTINNSHTFNDLQFDINAEVEPFNQDNNDNNFVINCGDMNNDFEEMSEEDRNAVSRCRGIRRQSIWIEDMQPVENSSKLEYRYRPLENIHQYWAGPSHWKWLQTQTNQKKDKSSKKKIRKKFKEITFDRFSRFKSSHVATSFKKKSWTLTSRTITQRWSAKKLKLPIDYKVDPEIFNKFKYAPNLESVDEYNENDKDNHSQVESHESYTETETERDVNQSNFGEISRRSSGIFENFEASSEHADALEKAHETDTEMEFDTSFTQMDTAESDSLEHSSGFYDTTLETEFEISSIYPGAPEKVEKYPIPYAKQAKVVNIKELKQSCWDIIIDKTAEASESQDFDVSSINLSTLSQYKAVTFNMIREELPRILPKKVSKKITTSLTLYSVLQLANQHSLILNQHADLENFDIITEY